MTNGRLLWVDDEIELLRGHIVFLEKKGYDVQTCVSGADAIETCRQNKFDLILLDENMPGLSGLETLSAIKDITPSVPVVMVTKNEAEDLMDQAIGSQIADYLLKPVNPHQILLTLKKNIHVETIRSETAGSAYRREFMQIDSLISQTLDIEGWMSLYKKLVRWEFELSDAPEAMNEMLRSQWHDAEKA
ncbi:MAG: response regulator, partial [Alloprevotella sp.]|nr:response regulator [Prevotellamassilia sp.]MDY5762623.1 response regulator [Alloprevotella sp.]